MKLIIDIDDELYDYMQTDICNSVLDNRFDYAVRYAVKDGIPFPKDATNGDILRIIFPKAKHELQKFYEEDTIVFDLNLFYMRISADWWNSPYKENKDGRDS